MAKVDQPSVLLIKEFTTSLSFGREIHSAGRVPAISQNPAHQKAMIRLDVFLWEWDDSCRPVLNPEEDSYWKPGEMHPLLPPASWMLFLYQQKRSRVPCLSSAICSIKNSRFVYCTVFSVLSQEVLELAFSILYDSNCQLNFIAPDKHEVRGLGNGLTCEWKIKRKGSSKKEMPLLIEYYLRKSWIKGCLSTWSGHLDNH